MEYSLVAQVGKACAASWLTGRKDLCHKRRSRLQILEHIAQRHKPLAAGVLDPQGLEEPTADFPLDLIDGGRGGARKDDAPARPPVVPAGPAEPTDCLAQHPPRLRVLVRRPPQD